MLSITLVSLFQETLAQVQACHRPNPFEFVLIVALVSGIGVSSTATGMAVTSTATTIVNLLHSGAGISTIVAAISDDTATGKGSFELLAEMIASIKNVLGC